MIQRNQRNKVAVLTATPRVVSFNYRRGGSGDMTLIDCTPPVIRLYHTQGPRPSRLPFGATLIKS